MIHSPDFTARHPVFPFGSLPAMAAFGRGRGHGRLRPRLTTKDALAGVSSVARVAPLAAAYQ
jgi:hypothetical protein